MTNVVEITVQAKDQASTALGGVGKALAPLKEKVTGALVPLAKMGVALVTVASTAISAAPVIAPVAVAVFAVGQAALAAAPALIAFKVAGAFVKATFTQIFKEGNALLETLEPLKKAFEGAGKEASKAAAAGIKPLAEELRRAVMPEVEASMVRIGTATNFVMRGFLGWAATKDGVSSIRGALQPIGEMMTGLAPNILRVAISFVQLMGRIMGVSLAAGGGGLAGVLDKVADVLDRIDAGTVVAGMTKLRDTFDTVVDAGRVVVGWIKKVVEAYKLYTTEFIAVADAVSVAAIAFGGPVIAIVAGIGLVIRHFDEFKAAYEGLKEAFSSGELFDGGVMGDLKAAGEEILPSLKGAFEDLKEAVLPVLEDIGHQIKDELAPAFAEFVEAASPFVSWLVDTLGPVVAETFANIGRIISGAIDIITGIFKVFTAILKGDWGKACDGIKDIARGVGKILGAILRQLWNLIGGIFRAGRDTIVKIWDRMFDIIASAAKQGIKNAGKAIRGAGDFFGDVGAWLRDRLLAPFKNAGSWLVNAGKWMVHGLASGISAVSGWVKDAIRWIIPDFLEHFIPGFAHGGIVGAAGGGPRGGLVMVGEQGRELVRLPGGSSVIPNGQTEAMMGGSGGGQPLQINLHLDGRVVAQVLVDPLRGVIRQLAGSGPGAVQTALGGGR